VILNFNRFSDKARAAFYFSFLGSIRDGSEKVEPIHLLLGTHCSKPQIFEGVDFGQLGVAPIDTSDAEQIQGEMQERFMKASIASGNEGTSGEMTFMSSFTPSGKVAMEAAAECSETFGARTVGTPHLIFGILKADPNLAAKLRRANLSEERVVSLCRNYKDGEEGESLAQTLEEMRPRHFRSGIGYDLHRLEKGRPLIVGGVELLFDKGPAGHSDGDVLAHAICDALLGAAGLGDIGTHFPDSDPKWKGANSLLFLEHAKKLLEEKKLAIEHVDAVVILEKPKLGPHFPKMREALAKSLGVSVEKIHLKAKTNEGVDAVGRGEAIAAQVVATLASR
jgi:2-C-methyl-D-erythritol 2,4-cyclodiphosphate synthase